MIGRLKAYAWNVLVALDILLNALTGGLPGETISHRAKRQQDERFWRLLCKLLHLFDKRHCFETEF